MTRRITYKQISIAIGVIVAVIILVVIWLNPTETSLSGIGIETTPKISIPAGNVLLQKIQITLQHSFR